ncbi:hypothetical protein [Marinilabilia rubra]|uniref:Uncharacterized protein n=1 Tax=Marinilabilia rubra TaxID=2162893 RepID=A0A2U2B648_9BACT|nr:hypothetical protein [Marinilabilia rubra]PWD98549.1 hypothetical protein DDZ16_15025 [Marinilabilia rubra]
MEKDALLEILSHDLKEVDSLIQSVKGNKNLSQAFFKLSRNRIKSILEELEMLEELSGVEKPADAEISISKASAKVKDTPKIEDNQLVPDEDVPPLKESIPEVTEDKEAPEEPTQPIETPKDTAKVEPKEEESKPGPEPEVEQETSSPKEEISTQEPPKEEPSEKPQPQKSPKAQDSKKESKVLGEKLSTGKSSFNERIAQNQTGNGKKRSFTTPPISDLKKALGINDRFFFQRELFGNNTDLMNQTLDQLNEMNGINDAQNFLLANFNWDPENEAVHRFMEIVERRYF